MILSALLTSVGINLGLCFLFFTLYSILRKQPGNVTVYAPRLINESKSQETIGFNLERLLPSAGWVRRAWELSEDELLSIAGLDAVVFMRIFIFSLRVFTIATILGICILLPINYLGNQLTYDFSDLPSKSVDSFSISNVDNGSNRLWVHFCTVYVFTGAVCYLLYYEYKYISLKRIAYFYASEPQPHHFTLLVRGIPATTGRSFSQTVEDFFMEYHPSTYLSHSVVFRTRKLQNLINGMEKLYRRVAHLKSDGSKKRFKRYGFLGLFGGRSVDLVEHYGKKLAAAEDTVRLEQSSVAREEVPAAFVSFKSRFGAAVALHIQQGINPTQWVTEQAPEPKDIYWPFFSSSFVTLWVLKIVVVVAYITVTALFLIPVVIVQGLTHLEQLETWFPFLKGVLSLAFISQLITGYLPSLILQLFLSFIPPIMIMLSSIQGHISLSRIEKSACTKMLWFTIWNIFFANLLSGSTLYRVKIIFEPKEIPKVLGEAVPSQASFFIAYVVTSGWTSLSSEIFRLFPFLCNLWKRLLCRDDTDDFEVPSIPYHSEIPRLLLFGLLGIIYVFLAPLILPFLLIYYCFGYIVYRNQLLNVYVSKFETGGKFWPIVHNSMVFCLVLMHIIAIGIFGLKALPLASSLILPLPVLTLVFNEYCRKRFLPIFQAYATELARMVMQCLERKDRDGGKNPAGMSRFLQELVTAYDDPALKPRRYSGSSDDGHDSSSPLLISA